MSDTTGSVVRRAAASHGLLTRVDLATLGVTRRQLDRLRSTGVLRQVTANVFRVGDHQPTWRTNLRIASLEAPAGALSDMAAGAIWHFEHIGEGAVEVSQPRAARVPTNTIGRVHRRRAFDPLDTCRVDGLPVTSPTQTILDLAPRLGPTMLDQIVQDACRRDLTSLARLRTAFDAWRGRGRPGVRRLEDLLASSAYLPRCDSWLEARFLRLMVEHGLPLPRTQVLLHTDGLDYRVDALWEEIDLIVELNGYATHGTRAETAAHAERCARLSAAGYEVVTFTHDQVVGRPQYVVAQVGRRVLRQQRSA